MIKDVSEATFMADVVERFTQVIGLERYALVVQDYGGPVGMRLAIRRPERVSALVVQNAVEGRILGAATSALTRYARRALRSTSTPSPAAGSSPRRARSCGPSP